MPRLPNKINFGKDFIDFPLATDAANEVNKYALYISSSVKISLKKKKKVN